MIATLVVQATEPSGEMRNKANTLWLNTTDGYIYYWNGSSYVKSSHDPETHLHPALGDINFTGDVSAGGQEGVTGEYQGTITKIKVSKGIVTEVEIG